MPLYSYACGTCASRREVVKPLAQLDEPVECLHCPAMMARQICAPAVLGDYKPYSCPITGKLIEGRRAHDENLRRHGCRVFEPGEREEHSRRAADSETSLEDRCAETAAELFVGMPAAQKERLAAEIDNGAEAPIMRN